MFDCRAGAGPQHLRSRRIAGFRFVVGLGTAGGAMPAARPPYEGRSHRRCPTDHGGPWS
ncbi:hypothetical protein SALBM311S_00195 [Streptomyces alboniger]